MSEKRFSNLEIIKNLIMLDDNDKFTIFTEKTLCNLLNSLIDENKHLKEQLQMIEEIIQTQITKTEEDLQTSVKGGMPTGSLYSEIGFLQKLKKECFDE